MKLEGTWYVIATNFPMWTKGTRSHPKFIYSNQRMVEGRECFDDTVEYLQAGRIKTVVGVDTSEGGRKFVWRGKGWLKFFASRWEIIAVAEDEQCLALAFTRTWATPEGIDIIARSPTVSEEAYAELHSAIGSPALTRLVHA